MMKLFLKVNIISLIAGFAVMAAPIKEDANATVTSYEYKLTKDGYFFEYSTSNGITRRENGVYVRNVKANNDDSSILRVNGSYSYIDENGERHSVSYGADENGYSVRNPIQAALAVFVSASASLFGGEYEISAQQPKGISSAALASLSGG